MKHKKKNKQELQVEVTKKPIMVDGVEIKPSQRLPLDAIKTLGEYEMVNSHQVLDKLSNNGWDIAEDTMNNTISGFNLIPTGNPIYAGFIPGIAYAFNADYTKVQTAPTMIANTVYGPMYAAPGTNGDGTEVIGPVVNPCFVGTPSYPAGLFIPFRGGLEAMEAGRHMIDSIIKNDILFDKAVNQLEIDDDECNCKYGSCDDCHCYDGEQDIHEIEFTDKDKMW